MRFGFKSILLLVLIASLTIFFFYHQKNFRCIFIHSNDNFLQVEENIFVSKDTPPDLIDSLVSLVIKSENNLSSFWGGLMSSPTIIYCNTSAAYRKFGVPNTAALCRLGHYVIFSSYGLNEEVISHEICHAEIFSRIGENYFRYYTKLPCWFDEGIALQFDSRNIYNITEEQKNKVLSNSELKNLDRPGDFYLKDQDKTRNNYIASKIEIENFIKKNSINALINLLEIFKNSGDFYPEYYKLRAL